MKLTESNMNNLTQLTAVANSLVAASVNANCALTLDALNNLACSVVAVAADIVSPVKVLTINVDHLGIAEIADMKRAIESFPVFAGIISTCEGCETSGKLPEHATECQFEHFLSYSGLHAEPDDVKAKLRQAFEAAK